MGYLESLVIGISCADPMEGGFRQIRHHAAHDVFIYTAYKSHAMGWHCGYIIKNAPPMAGHLICLAEREGFEPPDPRRSTVFKTAAIDHSAIFPGAKLQ